jgi:3D (Asp-Asp-Asp) domain-containing protein
MLLSVVAAFTVLLVLRLEGKQIDLAVGDEEQRVFSFKDTVKDVLEEQNITLGPDDIVVPALETPVKHQQKVTITRVDKEEFVVEQSIPFETVKQANDRMFKGEEKVTQQGANGLKQLVYQRVLHDGQEVSQQLIKTVVVNEPQAKIIAVGRRAPITVASRSMATSRPVSGDGAISMVATAYTYTGNNTASGTPPCYGTVAVDPRVIPMGTRIYVEGYGEAVALDRGSSIKGSRIDLFFPTRAEAVKWGRRTVKVHIVE